MKAYTNYPLYTNPQSGTVEIEVFSYDRNKYADVRHEGEEEDIKIGYIYKDPALTKTVFQYPLDDAARGALGP